MVEKGAKYIDSVNPSKELYGKYGRALYDHWSVIASAAFQVVMAFGAFLAGYWQLGIIVLALVPTTGCLAYLIGINQIRTMKADEALHVFMHNIRDDLARLPDDPHQRAVETEPLLLKYAENVAAVFRQRLGDDSINCLIRLAEMVDGVKQYYTAVRTEGLSKDREEFSEPLRADEGIAKAFYERRCVGAFLISDVEDAAERGIWKLGPNDKLEDANTYLVVPINGWVDGTKSMLGILHLTSQKNPFRPAHWITLKIIVDTLGLVLPQIIESLPESEAFNSYVEPKTAD